MMKNPLKALDVNEDDNLFTAAGKGGLQGTVVGTLASVAIWGGLLVVGHLVKNKDGKSVIEEITKEEA